MAELDQQLRDLIDAVALPVTAEEVRSRSTKMLPSIGPATRRPRRWLAAVAAVSLIAAGVTVAVTRGENSRVTTDQEPRSTTTVVSGVEFTGVEVVADNTLYDLSSSPPRVVDIDPRPATEYYGSPTRTGFGLVALTRVQDGRGDLVLIGDSGPTTIWPRVYAFAVDGVGGRVAYATSPNPIGQIGGTTTVTVARLPSGDIESRVDFRGIGGSGSNAAPIGWAGPYVMLNTGDGAGSRAAIWKPGDNFVTPIGSGTVVDTDRTRPRAIVALNDGSCGGPVSINEDRSITVAPAAERCVRAVSPSGNLVASVTADGAIVVNPFDDPFSAVATWQVPRGRSPFITDITWVDERRLVMTRSGDVIVCAIGLGCSTTALPTADTVISIVRPRPFTDPTPTATPRASIPPVVEGPRPPLAHLAVAIAEETLDIVDTRSVQAVHRIDVLAKQPRDGRNRALQWVAISPDKSTAIVSAIQDGGTQYSLWTVDLRTDEVRLLSEDALWPAFSPDGLKLSYVRTAGSREGSNTIVIRDIRTACERVLVRSGTEALSRIGTTVWAPDSRTLAYTFGYYGSDTYLIDTETAIDLDRGRKLEAVALIEWREPDVAFGSWFCCFEAEPPVPSVYRISTGEHTPVGAPAGLGFLDRNDQDTRLAGVDQSAGQYVVRFTDVSGRLVALPGYRHMAW